MAADTIEGMDGSPEQVAQEAVAVAVAAVALAGGHVDPYTHDLITQMGRGEISGDEAVAAVIARFVGPVGP